MYVNVKKEKKKKNKKKEKKAKFIIICKQICTISCPMKWAHYY